MNIAAASFNYQPLCGDNDIRLLQLDVDADKIACKITHSSLEQEYVALSYTWGDPNPIVSRKNKSPWETYPTISCNGQEAQIQRNLFEALQVLKSSRESRYIWVDALCINQRDHDERRSQVAIMGYVYARATEVIIWLGAEDGTTASAASAVERMSTSLHWLASENLGLGHITASELDLNEAKLFYADTAINLYHLLSRTWFRRGWVVQEAALARRCRVLCGRHEFDLTAFWFCATMLANSILILEHYVDQDSREVYIEGSKGLGAFTMIYDTRLEVEKGGYRATEVQPRLRKRCRSFQDQQLPFAYLDDLLFRTRVFEFERAEDRILAPMALIRTLFSPQPSSADCFESAHKNSSIRHFYIGTTRLIAERTASLSILSLSGLKSSDNNLPTWVPEFSLRKTSLFQEGFQASQGWSVHNDPKYGHVQGIRDSTEQTFGSTKSLDSLLAITAIFFDDIQTETESARGRLPSFSETSEWFRMLDELPSTYSWSGESSIAALGKTLLTFPTSSDSLHTAALADFPPDWFEESVRKEFESTYELYTKGDHQKSEHSASLGDAYQVILPISKEEFHSRDMKLLSLQMIFSSGQMIEGGPVREFSSEVFKLIQKDVKSRTYLKNMFMERYFKFTLDRRLALTGQKALCLVPGATRVGDRVVFLRGSNMPFILRPGSTTGNFVLVGEAYVHGLMTGKVMELGLEQKQILLE